MLQICCSLAHDWLRLPLTVCLEVQEGIQPELDAHKSFLQGLDKKGRPLSICMPKRHRKSTRVLDKTKGLIAYCLDNCIKAIDTDRNPTGKTVAIFDLRGMYNPQPRFY